MSDSSGFDDFYVAVYPRLVGALTVIAGDAAAAEDAVQEAFVRLVRRWDKVSAYDDPAAWVRRVALNLISHQHRSRRRLRSVLPRLAGSSSEPEAPEPASHGDGQVAQFAGDVADLPLPHRQVLVLHYGYGLSVAEIAAELGVAPGTVKSRLSRARAAIAPALVDPAEEADHV